jgi:hypothetical protein
MESEIFNCFDAGLCDAAGAADLRDLLAVPRAPVAFFVFDCPADFALVGRPAGALEDFLRDFLDIRLPFVAFGGSIMRLLQVLSGHPEKSYRLCKPDLCKSYLWKSDRAGVWLQEIRRTCSLVKGAVSAI